MAKYSHRIQADRQYSNKPRNVHIRKYSSPGRSHATATRGTKKEHKKKKTGQTDFEKSKKSNADESCICDVSFNLRQWQRL